MVGVTLVRHATLLLELAGRTILVDPMLDDAGAQPPVPDTENPQRNPLVGLPAERAAIVGRADAVCVTHLHVDHFDTAGAEAVKAAGVPVLCQPEDEERLRALGCERVVAVEHRVVCDGIEVTRTGGSHGTGRIAEMLAPVSGFLLVAGGDRLYVAGDTVWCDDVRGVLVEHRPTVVVVNAGEARLREGDPITMDAADVIAVAKAAEGAVVAVHMEALNHCVLSREGLAGVLARAGVDVHIPADGETLTLGHR